MSDFVSGVQMRDIKDALHHYTVDGPMGLLLDAETDGWLAETVFTLLVSTTPASAAMNEQATK